MASFPQVSPLEPCAHLSPPTYAPHAPPISFFSVFNPDTPITKKMTPESLKMNIFISVYFNIYARNAKKIPLIAPNDMMSFKVLFANTAHSRMTV
jgi:hypothetical protein